MIYSKVFTDENGEKYPYSESFDDDSYYYAISIMWNDRDGELHIVKPGINIIFDDDGSWLDFNIAPEDIFPNKNKLIESDLLKLMNIIEMQEETERKLYTRKDMGTYYQKYLDLK